jgi:hypothetical protein
MSTKNNDIKYSPTGSAMWAYLRVPQEGFKEKSGRVTGKPKFVLNLRFDPQDPEWKAWASDLEKRSKDLGFENRPFREEVVDGEKTGLYMAKFSTGAEYPPSIFDGANNDNSSNAGFDYEIGNGSKCIAAYKEASYEGFGGGFNFYLNSVQVEELVEYQGGANCVFQPIAGAVAVSGPAAEVVEVDDEIPF